MSTVDSPLLGHRPQHPHPNDVEHPLSHSKRRQGPGSHVLKVLAVFWTFLIMGAGDAAYGVRTVEKNRLAVIETNNCPAFNSLRKCNIAILLWISC